MKKSLLIMLGMAVFMGLTGSVYAAGDAAAGKAITSKCVGCHGDNGLGKDKNPPIAGLKADYFTEQMGNYKSGSRNHMMMNMIAGKLSDQDIADLAAYYATLKAK